MSQSSRDVRRMTHRLEQTESKQATMSLQEGSEQSSQPKQATLVPSAGTSSTNDTPNAIRMAQQPIGQPLEEPGQQLAHMAPNANPQRSFKTAGPRQAATSPRGQIRRTSVAYGPVTGQQPSARQARKQSMGQAYAGYMPTDTQVRFIHPQRLYKLSMVQQIRPLGQQQTNCRPQTMITATSDNSVRSSQNSLNRSGQQIDQSSYGHQQTLIPIPPDQMHLRRLSDQTSLMRRSSITADLLDGPAMTRNRSHSNIDAVSYKTYLTGQVSNESCSYQQQQHHDQLKQSQHLRHYHLSDKMTSREHLPSHYTSDEHLGLRQQLRVDGSQLAHHRRSSDQWDLQRRAIQQQHQQQQQMFDSDISGSQMASLITSCSDKGQQQLIQYQQAIQSSRTTSNPRANNNTRRSSEDIRTDSSSDPDDSPLKLQTQVDSLQGAFSNNESYLWSENYSNTSAVIPSVNVSQFCANQRLQELLQRHRHSICLQIQQQQQQQQQQQHEHILATPTEINSATEQLIERQQHDVYGTGNGASYLARPNIQQRRGSGTRVLPKTPGEQSKSMLDLAMQNGGQLVSNGVGQGQFQQASCLDLPSPGAASRRASAPEGENITIVVDDIDHQRQSLGASHLHHNHHHHHHLISDSTQRSAAQVNLDEYCERITLYREAGLSQLGQHADASELAGQSASRTFGLHVVGGKIDQFGRLQAHVSWILAGGPADKAGIRPGDRIVEWDGRSLINMTYEQVAELIESSSNSADLIVKPAAGSRRAQGQQADGYVIRSKRRLSQQTEQDLRRQPAGLATGTGRRLPKIPAMAPAVVPAAAAASVVAVASAGATGLWPSDPLAGRRNSTSAGQLELQGQFLGACLQDQQQQSHSTGELISSSACAQLNGSSWFVPAGSRRNHPGRDSLSSARELYVPELFQGASCRLGLQIAIDERRCQLDITVVSAKDAVGFERGREYCVRIKILSESVGFKTFTTGPSSTLTWSETFIFQNFPVQQTHSMALDVGIWPHRQTHLMPANEEPVCETLIAFQNAREHILDFWPLTAPAVSRKERRKSLNDLMESCLTNASLQAHGTPTKVACGQAAGRKIRTVNWSPTRSRSRSSYLRTSSGEQARPSQASLASSNRNLHELNRQLTRGQPRRASDEAATSLGQRPWISPAASRRSISVINVGGPEGGRPMSGQPRASEQPKPPGEGPPASGASGALPATMATDSKASKPVSLSNKQEGARQTRPASNPAPQAPAQKRIQSDSISSQRAGSQSSSTCDSPRSRRGSNELNYIQRKGSVAIQTLRRLTRTMSMSKPSEAGPKSRYAGEPRSGSSQGDDSSDSDKDQGPGADEPASLDLGVVRRLLFHQRAPPVGQLKLRFALTKGQLEIEIIRARELKLENENLLGVYVKLCLKGTRSRSNKQKTRLVSLVAGNQANFRQTIKYAGSLVDNNKTLEVNLWKKLRKSKQPYGFTEVQLAELGLAQSRTSWFWLHPMEAQCSSSIEEP